MRSPNSLDNGRTEPSRLLTTKMKLVDRIEAGGIPKGEMIIFAAESNVGKSKFPKPLVRRSHRLSNIKLTALGGIFMGGLHVIIFIAKTGEWFWGLLPDRCEHPDCRRMGIRGNENLENGIRLCDYCSYLKLWGEQGANRK